MTSLVMACSTFYIEPHKSDICCFRATTLSPLHLAVICYPKIVKQENIYETAKFNVCSFTKIGIFM